MKVCSKCGENKELGAFAIQSTGRQGRRADCKLCVKRFVRSVDGVIKQIYSMQKSKSKKRGYTLPTYTEIELSVWIKAQPLFKSMYNAWVLEEYSTNIKPSIDRINDRISYTLSNIQLTTVQQNVDRYHVDAINGDNTKRCKAVDMLDLSGNFIQRFHSTKAAAKNFGNAASHSSISRVCNKKIVKRIKPDGSIRTSVCQKAYGHKWRYSNKPNENTEII